MTSEHEPFARLRDADPAAERLAAPSIAPLLERLEGQHEAARPLAPRGRRQLCVVLAVTVLVIAAALGAVGLVGRGPGGLDVVARARAALATNGAILHVATRYEQQRRGGGRSDGGDGRGTAVMRNERWSVQDPTRFRITRQLLAGRVGNERAPGPVYEEDYAGRRFRSTAPEEHELRVAVVPRRLASLMATQRLAVSAMTGFGQLGVDPVRAIGRMLDEGLIEEAGERELNGRRLLRLVYRPRAADVGRGRFVRGTGGGGFFGASFPVEYLVDATTYAPVRISYGSGPAGQGQRGRAANEISFLTTISFETYERLPLTTANERLLRIDEAGLRVVRDDSLVGGRARRLAPAARRP